MHTGQTCIGFTTGQTIRVLLYDGLGSFNIFCEAVLVNIMLCIPLTRLLMKINSINENSANDPHKLKPRTSECKNAYKHLEH